MEKRRLRPKTPGTEDVSSFRFISLFNGNAFPSYSSRNRFVFPRTYVHTRTTTYAYIPITTYLLIRNFVCERASILSAIFRALTNFPKHADYASYHRRPSFSGLFLLSRIVLGRGLKSRDGGVRELGQMHEISNYQHVDVRFSRWQKTGRGIERERERERRLLSRNGNERKTSGLERRIAEGVEASNWSLHFGKPRRFLSVSPRLFFSPFATAIIAS